MFRFNVKDIQNFLLMSIPDKTIMVFDDYPSNWGIFGPVKVMGDAWEAAVHYKAVQEVFRCTYKFTLFSRLERGFVVSLVKTSKDFKLKVW